MTSHLWITGSARRQRESTLARCRTAPVLGVFDAHRRLRGPYTGAGSLLRAIVPELWASDPGLVRQHDIEILTAAPEIAALTPCERASLTWTSAAEERTRFYPRAHTTRVAHGLVELLRATGAGRAVVLENLHEADETDAELVAIMLRRLDPHVLQVIVCSSDAAPEACAEALVAHAGRVHAGGVVQSTPTEGGAEAYVRSDCTSDDPELVAAYEALEPAARAALHDARGDELEARSDVSLRLGAIPLHRERGSDPTGAGATALTGALEHCVLRGFYHAVLDLGHRAHELLDWDDDPEACWLVTAKVTTALTALGRPDDAARLYDEACAATTLPAIHLQAAYGRAMLYTRFFEDGRRDHAKAKGWINTAIAIASQMPPSRARAFNLTFQENGLALIEMHLGDPERALELVMAGLGRLDREMPAGEQTLHRSVLRYNAAQLLTRMRRLNEALQAYTEAITVDPHHSEYHFERAAVHRALGQLDAARADYDSAIRLSPPYPEPHYNRAELLMELGDVDGALADLSYVIELDPSFLDAYVNRASLRFELGDAEAADRDVRAGLRIDPLQPHLHCIAAMLAWRARRLEEAHQRFAAALAADPGLTAAWTNRAVLHWEQGALDDAVHCLTEALAISDDPVVRENRALVLEQAGRAEQARHDRQALGVLEQAT